MQLFTGLGSGQVPLEQAAEGGGIADRDKDLSFFIDDLDRQMNACIKRFCHGADRPFRYNSI